MCEGKRESVREKERECEDKKNRESAVKDRKSEGKRERVREKERE